MEEVPTQEQINSLVPVPKESLEIDQEKALRWVEAETDPEYQAIKRKIVENIQHVSFHEFKKNAEKVIQEAIDELAKDNEKYALFFDYKPYSSKRWVAELTPMLLNSIHQLTLVISHQHGRGCQETKD